MSEGNMEPVEVEPMTPQVFEMLMMHTEIADQISPGQRSEGMKAAVDWLERNAGRFPDGSFSLEVSE